MLTKDTSKGLDNPLWQHGPEILGNREMWQQYKPTKSNVDAIPVFCGNVAIGEYADPLPNPAKFDSYKDLLLETCKAVLNINENGEKALIQSENVWFKYVQSAHFPEIIEFLQKLKGNNFRSLEGKRITRSQKLIAPSLLLS